MRWLIVFVLFAAVTTSADVSITKVEGVDPIIAGSFLNYFIDVLNDGASPATVTFTDTIPANTTFLELVAPGWATCTTPPVGGTGMVSCTRTLNAGSPGTATLRVTVNDTTPAGTIITNTANVTSPTDTDPANNSATTTTTVAPSNAFTVTKTVAGSFIPGTSVTYTVVLTNNMGQAQPDNSNNEFGDTLPAGLQLTGATASSGTVTLFLPSNVMTWSGAIADAASVTITITATLTATSGTISNQGVAFVDVNNNGANETSVFSDDPSTPAPHDPTSFNVAEHIPALDEWALIALGAMLAAIALLVIKR